MSEDLVLTGEDLGFRYGQGPWVLRHCDLQIETGQRLLLRGPNGCGKSTLLRLLAGQMHALEGQLAGAASKALLAQETSIDWTLPLLAREVVAMGALAARRWWWPWGGRADIDQALADVGLADAARRPANELSGGQRRRLLLARCLLQGADLILLDEPLSGLDSSARKALAEALTAVTGPDRAALIIASHEIVDFPMPFDVDLHFDEGKLIATADAHCEMDR